MADVKDIVALLGRGQALTESQAGAFLEEVMEGRVGEQELAAAVTAIAQRPGGPTVDEIVGGARVMRRFVTAVAVQQARGAGPEPVVIDTCGTGGAPKTFNVSTVAAFVIAAAAPGR